MLEIFKSNKQEPEEEAAVAGGRRWLARQPARRGTPLWARAALARKLRRQRESEEAREPSNPIRVLNLRGDDVEEEVRPRGSLLPLTNPITKKRKGREGDGDWGGDEVEEEMEVGEEKRRRGAAARCLRGREIGSNSSSGGRRRRRERRDDVGTRERARAGVGDDGGSQRRERRTLAAGRGEGRG
jgi:hypothetical protein